MATSEKQGIPAIEKGPSVCEGTPAVDGAVGGVVEVLLTLPQKQK